MIEKDEVRNLAALARIELSEEEVSKLQEEFGAILDYVSELNEVAATEEEPQATGVYNVMRPDTNPHESGVFTEQLLEEMPQREGQYLKVKKIL